MDRLNQNESIPSSLKNHYFHDTISVSFISLIPLINKILLLDARKLGSKDT